MSMYALGIQRANTGLFYFSDKLQNNWAQQCIHVCTYVVHSRLNLLCRINVKNVQMYNTIHSWIINPAFTELTHKCQSQIQCETHIHVTSTHFLSSIQEATVEDKAFSPIVFSTLMTVLQVYGGDPFFCHKSNIALYA